MRVMDEHSSESEASPGTSAPQLVSALTVKSFITANLLTVKALVLALTTMLVLSVSYYFVVALPSADRERLRFERQKYSDAQRRYIEEQSAKKLKEDLAEIDRKSKQDWVMSCQVDAEKAYWSYVKLNGKEVKADVYSAAPVVWASARARKDDSYKDCMALLYPVSK